MEEAAALTGLAGERTEARRRGSSRSMWLAPCISLLLLLAETFLPLRVFAGSEPPMRSPRGSSKTMTGTRENQRKERERSGRVVGRKKETKRTRGGSICLYSVLNPSTV
jgi:hypothetical protein